MRWYVITVKADNGLYRLKTIATSEDMAKMIVLKAENCPESAIVKIEEQMKL